MIISLTANSVLSERYMPFLYGNNIQENSGFTRATLCLIIPQRSINWLGCARDCLSPRKKLRKRGICRSGRSWLSGGRWEKRVVLFHLSGLNLGPFGIIRLAFHFLEGADPDIIRFLCLQLLDHLANRLSLFDCELLRSLRILLQAIFLNFRIRNSLQKQSRLWTRSNAAERACSN